MTIHPTVRAIQEKHSPHSAQPAGECETCLVLSFLSLAYDGLNEVQRMSSMQQWDPQGVAEYVRRGFGG